MNMEKDMVDVLSFSIYLYPDRVYKYFRVYKNIKAGYATTTYSQDPQHIA